jgi:DNA (cytosine-5)-methyltransferase 1
MILDLFAGAGGASLGIRRALPDADLLGIDNDLDSCLTQGAAGMPAICADITRYSTAPFLDRVEGLWASPPCTDFSRAGKRAGIDGETGMLIYEAHLWASKLWPDWIIFEQVPDVLPWWLKFAGDFAERGYSTWAGILNSADYGVPQTRERAILIASRLTDVGPPTPTHARNPHPVMFGPEELPWVSMAEALGWDESDEPNGWKLATNRDQRPDGSRQEIPIDNPAPSVTAKAGGQWKLSTGRHDYASNAPRPVSEPAPTLRFGHDVNSWEWVFAGPAPTIVGTRRSRDGAIVGRAINDPAQRKGQGGHDWVNGRPATTVAGTPRISKPGHRDREGGERQFNDSIKVTLTELAILQDFPADHPFKGNKTSRARQIGNAVPSRLAEACVRSAVGT